MITHALTQIKFILLVITLFILSGCTEGYEEYRALSYVDRDIDCWYAMDNRRPTVSVISTRREQ